MPGGQNAVAVWRSSDGTTWTPLAQSGATFADAFVEGLVATPGPVVGSSVAQELEEVASGRVLGSLTVPNTTTDYGLRLDLSWRRGPMGGRVAVGNVECDGPPERSDGDGLDEHADDERAIRPEVGPGTPVPNGDGYGNDADSSEHGRNTKPERGSVGEWGLLHAWKCSQATCPKGATACANNP